MQATLKTKLQEKEATIWRIYETTYFVALVFALINVYKDITMFWDSVVLSPFYIVTGMVEDLLFPFLFVFLFLCMMASRLHFFKEKLYWSVEETIFALIGAWIFLTVYFLFGYREPYLFALFISGAHNISSKKVLNNYFFISSIICLIVFVCGCTGLIENLIYDRGDGTMRIAFGFVYPTDFCSHIFFLTIIYLWLRKADKITWYEIFGILGLIVFVYVACNARTTTATLLLVFLLTSWRKLSRKTKRLYPKNKQLWDIFTWFTPIAAATTIVMSLLYSSESKLFVFFNRLLNTRLSQSKLGFERYDLTLFGQSVAMYGNGGKIELKEEYFFLDVTYINILLRYGLFALLFVLFAYMVIVLYEKNKKCFYFVGLLTIIALQCTMEQHLLEFGHCPFLLLLFAVDDKGVNPIKSLFWEKAET